jgi:SAM-dependent methyltransferase
MNYDRFYRHSNHYGYRRWVFAPYVRALVKKAGLAKGNTVLDLGCGQGMFTALLREAGLTASGIDLSAEAVRSARLQYGPFFTQGDCTGLSPAQADAVFVRSCSLYNAEALEPSVTDKFISYLTPGGVLIWAYASRGQAISGDWKHHALWQARAHFAKYPSARVYFSLRMETLLLGRWAFSPLITELAWAFSRFFHCGGDLIALVKN